MNKKKDNLSEGMSRLTIKTPNGPISDFEVHFPIGKGTFSTVYKGICKHDNKNVAIKRIKIFEIPDEKTRKDCMKEIDLLQKLHHENIIKFFTSFTLSSDFYIVLELAEFGDLADLIDHCIQERVLFTENTIWNFFFEICKGVEHMHSKRIMHRDIKPANVFITSKGVVKIGDLGLSRFFSPHTMAAHSRVGTLYYMSAERIFGESYDFSSDIWSLGCLLYEMAALQSPFSTQRTNIDDLCKIIENRNYIPIPEPVYSDKLQKLVKQCLNGNPKERPDIHFLVNFAYSNSMCI